MSAVWLASGSPRRRDLLTWAGVGVQVVRPDIDERPLPGETAAERAIRLARSKARVVDHPGVVIAADTIVDLDGRELDKPRDRAEACSHLRALSGRWHAVTTGVCVRGSWATRAFTVSTRVRFRTLSDAEIEAYVATGEADDKAGAYGIQGRAGAFVAELAGSWTNVMGLPLEETLAALEEVR